MTIPKQTLLLASVMLLAVLSGCTTWLSPSYIRAGTMD